MELRYQVTGDDYRAHVKHVSRKINRVIKPWLSIVVMVGVITAATVLANRLYPRQPSGKRDPRRGIVVVVVAVAAIFGSRSLLRWRRRRFVDRALSGGPTVVDVTLALQPDGIATQSSTGHGLTYWHAVKTIERAGEHILIRVGIAGELIIPKRAFQDEQHMQVFLGEIERFRNQSASAPAAPQHPAPSQPSDTNMPPVQ